MKVFSLELEPIESTSHLYNISRVMADGGIVWAARVTWFPTHDPYVTRGGLTPDELAVLLKVGDNRTGRRQMISLGRV